MPRKKQFRICDVCGVTSNEFSITYSNKFKHYLCDKHLNQMKKYNKPINQTKPGIGKQPYKKNKILLNDSFAEIEIEKNDKSIVHVILDIEDVNRISQYCWHQNKNGYISTTYKEDGKQKYIYLHRFILNYYGDMDINHINKNILDNRKQNLRIADRTINNMNKTPGGIFYVEKENKYFTYIDIYGCRHYVGKFNTLEEAKIKRSIKMKEINNNIEFYKTEYENKKKEAGKNIRPLKNGKYQVSYRYKNKTINVGTFNNLADAKIELKKSRESLN